MRLIKQYTMPNKDNKTCQTEISKHGSILVFEG